LIRFLTAMVEQIKAVGLLSSGIDSALAIRLVKEQGIEVVAVNLVLPFADDREDYAARLARQLDVPLIRIEAGEDYIELVRRPRHGYGSGMNPCIDCRIYMLKRAWEVAEGMGARFLVTGDVLGERPMTQHRAALELEERESGLQGLVLRPLSARLLPETVPEGEGWVDREKLLAIKGRRRTPQLELARRYGITGFRTPGGGCLLTNKEFSARLKSLFHMQEMVSARDVQLLKIGRHFFHQGAHIIVGRNERENRLLLELERPEDYVLEAKGYAGPVTLLRGSKVPEAVEFAASLTARYSDAPSGEVTVECRSDGRTQTITASKAVS
jgi:tRNA-specific 2-thiouridylase